MNSALRDQFAILKSQSDLVYLDSAATALKPIRVIEKESEYYRQYCANINRGIYKISERATEEYERAREKVAKFINAPTTEEIVFVRNATEAINLVVYSWGRVNLDKGDEIALTVMEHHANLVPWQQLGKEAGATLRYLDIDSQGKLLSEGFGEWINKKTKIAAITHVSNVLGTVNNVKEIIQKIKEINPATVVLVDGAQAIPHLPVDISQFSADFYAFSGHKMYGPTGIGVLWGVKQLLAQMPPFQYGGDMVKEVGLEEATFKEPPTKFEAGTPHIAGAIGLGEAVEFLSEIGMEKVREHEVEINRYALEKLKSIKGIKIFGPMRAEERSGLVSFSIEGLHPHDLAQLLDEDGVAIRAGHHCAMPLHKRLGVAATARASFGVYTAKEEIDRLVEGIEKARRILRY